MGDAWHEARMQSGPLLDAPLVHSQLPFIPPHTFSKAALQWKSLSTLTSILPSSYIPAHACSCMKTYRQNSRFQISTPTLSTPTSRLSHPPLRQFLIYITYLCWVLDSGGVAGLWTGYIDQGGVLELVIYD